MTIAGLNTPPRLDRFTLVSLQDHKARFTSTRYRLLSKPFTTVASRPHPTRTAFCEHTDPQAVGEEISLWLNQDATTAWVIP